MSYAPANWEEETSPGRRNSVEFIQSTPRRVRHDLIHGDIDAMVKQKVAECLGNRILEGGAMSSIDQWKDFMEVQQKFNESMANGHKRKMETDPLPDEPLLIEESIEVKDNGHDIIEWALRNKLRPINGDPSVYWVSGTWNAVMAPNLAANLSTSHLFPLSVNHRVVRGHYDAKKCPELKSYLCKNRSCMESKKKLAKVIMETNYEGSEMNVGTGISWEGCVSVRDIVECLLNMIALDHCVRPHNYGSLVILRVLHENQYGLNFVKNTHEQRTLLESYINEMLQRNSGRAIQGKCPLVYSEAKAAFGEVADTQLVTRQLGNSKEDVYSACTRIKTLEKTLAEANALVGKLQTEIATMKSQKFKGQVEQPEVYVERGGGRGGRVRGPRGGRGGYGQIVERDPKFVELRSQVWKNSFV